MFKILFLLLTLFFVACNTDEKPKDSDNSIKITSNTNSASAILTETEKAEGWVNLFDGVSTKGWHTYGKTSIGSAWKVDQGVLHLDASQKENWQIKGGGDIVTDSAYTNFDFKLEWKIDTCGNSGVMFFVHEDTAKYKYPWNTGPEMQILDNKCHPDAKIIKHRAGDLYDIQTSTPETVKPALEWNAIEIKNVNGNLEFFQNGTKILSTTLWTKEWNDALKNTKWKDYADFAKFKDGKFALQDHGANVWFRNIKVRKL